MDQETQDEVHRYEDEHGYPRARNDHGPDDGVDSFRRRGGEVLEEGFEDVVDVGEAALEYGSPVGLAAKLFGGMF